MVIERVFGVESQIACIAPDMTARILQMTLKCGRGSKLTVAGLALEK